MKSFSMIKRLFPITALLAAVLLAGCAAPDGQSTPGTSIFEGGGLAGAAGGQETLVAAGIGHPARVRTARHGPASRRQHRHPAARACSHPG